MKKLLLAILVLSLIFAVAAPVFANPDPVPGQPAWDGKYAAAKVVAPSLGPASDIPNNPRTNASGDKITSNAHSADFPGLYFYWNDKQKDNGVLLVDASVFDLFVDGKFTLTAKNSNNYWGYEISKDIDQLIDGVYAYGISKQIKYNEIGNNGKVSAKTDDLKNINMVFIDGDYKPAYFKIVKVFYNEVGRLYGTGDSDRDLRGAAREARELPGLYRLVSFNDGYGLGKNKVNITDYKSAVNGKTITVTENDIPGFLAREKSINVTVKWNALPTIVFHNQKQYAKIKIEKEWIIYDDERFPSDPTATFRLNRRVVGPGTYDVKEGTYVIKEDEIANFDLIDIVVDIGDYDLAERTATIIAEAGKEYTVTFTNKEIPQAIIYIEKIWLDEFDNDITDEIDTYVNPDGKIPVAALIPDDYIIGENKVDAGTLVEFAEDLDKLDEWKYEDTSYLGKQYKKVTFQFLLIDYEIDGVVEDEISFTADAGITYNIVITNQLEIIPIPNDKLSLDKIPSQSHIARWASYGIYCLAGNTTKPDNKYFIALTPKFFDEYDSAEIWYCSGSGDDPQKITVTFGKCTLTPNFSYKAGGGSVPAGEYYVWEFPNVWGKGARQAYLISLTKKDGTVIYNTHPSTPTP